LKSSRQIRILRFVVRKKSWRFDETPLMDGRLILETSSEALAKGLDG